MSTPVRARELSAAEAAAYLALVQAHAAAVNSATSSVLSSVLTPLAAFKDWWDSDAITALTGQIVKQVVPGQRRVARLTDAYVARTVSRARGRTVRPAGAVDVSELRRKLPPNVIEDLAHGRRKAQVLDIGSTEDGPSRSAPEGPASLLKVDDELLWLDPRDPYGRLADMYRHEVIANDADHDAAVAKVLARAEAVVRTDMLLAQRKQETHTFGKVGVTYYRRVLHPELAKTGLSCGLCIVAADRIYTVKTLKAIHDGCNCGVIPIEGGTDPGFRLNRDDLDSLYAAAGEAVGTERETGGSVRENYALRRVRVAVTEHGELGPVLIAKGKQFRTATDFAKTQTADPRIRARAQLDTLIPSLARLEAAAAAGEDKAAPIKYHREQIAKLRRIAGA